MMTDEWKSSAVDNEAPPLSPIERCGASARVSYPAQTPPALHNLLHSQQKHYQRQQQQLRNDHANSNAQKRERHPVAAPAGLSRLPPPPPPDAAAAAAQTASAPSSARIRILAINDVYELENLPRLATLRRRLRPPPDAVVLAGDFLSPSMLSSIDQGRGMVDMLNRVRDSGILTRGGKERVGSVWL